MCDQLFQELGGYIQEQMERHHVPGVAIGVLHQEKQYMDGFGVTSVDHPLPVDEHTLFQIGSTTKTITATAVMRLQEMGVLDLDTPICRYLPGFKMADDQVARQATLRHLLTHSGGWSGDFFSDTGMGDDALATYVSEMAVLPQLTPLGSLWTYNNAGFSLAGRVIEVVTGQTYEQAVMDLVLNPLGMLESFFFPWDVMTLRFAVGHHSSEQRPEPYVARPWALARSAHSAGGVASSVNDQLCYARFHMGDGTAGNGTRLLSTAVLKEMQEPAVNASAGNKFGLSWFIKEISGRRLVFHGGATLGQLSAFLMIPEEDFAITILTNSNAGGYLNDDVTKWALKSFLDLEETEPQVEPRSKEELASYTGEYDAPLAIIRLAIEDGQLVLHYLPKGGFPDKDSPPPPTPPPTRVAFTAADQIISLDPPHRGDRAEFLRDQDGQIRWLRTSRLHKRL